MARWDPPISEGYSLHESGNDGGIRFLKLEAGAWRKIPHDEIPAIVEREQTRNQYYNEFVGGWQGKTVLIMATGPMMKRINKPIAQYLATRDDLIIIGINSAPKVCARLWFTDPDELFDAIVGADAVHPNIWNEWGWDLATKTKKFCKKKHYTYYYIPMKSTSEPSITTGDLYYRDSVTAAISLALLALASESHTKICAGPWMDWPQRRLVRADGGKVILLGVEHNNYDHCYTDSPEFLLYDDPDADWPNLNGKFDAHKKLKGFAREIGATIYQAAPWSRINCYETCDFEEFIGIPEEIRQGVSGVAPKKQQRVTDADDCSRYQDEMIAWYETQQQGEEPKKPIPLVINLNDKFNASIEKILQGGDCDEMALTAEV